MNEDDVALEALKFKIREERGFHANIYKDSCIRRRLAVRMKARECADFSAYATLLDADRAEYDRLIQTLTINVTKFFRNFEMWEVLRAEVIPRLLSQGGDDPIRAWSAGCSSGEEAYSLAIAFHEVAREAGLQDALERLDILGTDIDPPSLAAAAAAVFPELSFTETPPDVRARWFTGRAPARLRDDAKRSVRFEYADLISDPFPAARHLIVCRNVLIYFDRPAQERLFLDFHEALEPGGYLVLGRVETILGPARSLFRPVSTRERVYRKVQ